MLALEVVAGFFAMFVPELDITHFVAHGGCDSSRGSIIGSIVFLLCGRFVCHSFSGLDL